jgi:site-specific DNA-methyltransferase (adenine-specific)
MPIKYAHNHLKYCPVSERILFYGLHDQTGLQFVEKEYVAPRNPFAKELREARKKANKSINEIAEYGKFYGNVNHGGAVTNWERGYNVPLKDQWSLLCEYLPTLNKNYEDLRREYEDLRREYEDLRRPFNYRIKLYEVFSIPVVAGKDNTPHPTTNPRKLIRNLILCSTKENALVLDPFAGSGTTLLACRETGRNCIAFEKDPKYEPIIRKRAMLDTQELTSFQTFETASPCNLLTFS